jgi:hypothetical protein
MCEGRALLHELLRVGRPLAPLSDPVYGSRQQKPTGSRNEEVLYSGWGLASEKQPKAEAKRGESSSSFKPRPSIAAESLQFKSIRHVQLEACSCWCPAGVGCRGKYKAMLFFASFSPLSLETPLHSSIFSIDTQDAPTRIYAAEVRAHSNKWAHQWQRASRS